MLVRKYSYKYNEALDVPVLTFWKLYEHVIAVSKFFIRFCAVFE